MNAEIARRLVLLAYEQGWRHACTDHEIQRNDATHPIGSFRRDNAEDVLRDLDPHNLLGLA